MRHPFFALALGLAIAASAPHAHALTAERIGSTVRGHMSDVRACYVRALGLRPDLEGRVVVRFTVDASGAVSAASAESDTVGDPTMQACVLGAVRSWQFPRGEAAETVSYPFQFAR